MSLVAKQPESAPPVPGGNYQAVCYSVIDIGTHHSELYDKEIRQVVITWEIPSERITLERDGEKVDLPRALSKTYTLSLSEKSNLYEDLVSWRGMEFTEEELEGFDLHNILGANCMLNVVNKKNAKGKLTARIAGISQLIKGMPKVKPYNPVISFDLDKDTEIPSSIPEWINAQIKTSLEWQGDDARQAADTAGDAAMNPNPNHDPNAEGDDEIPF